MKITETTPGLVPYRGQFSEYDQLMNVPILRFANLASIELDLKNPARYIIDNQDYSLPIDFLFMPRASSEGLIVGFHGAEMRMQADLPKFQFVRSVLHRKESLLFVSDSTLLQGQDISLGWLAGNSKTPLGDLIADVIHKAAKNLRVTSTTLLGHSAGGFMALLVGSKLSNSHAISVNGQVSLGLHRDWTNTRLRETAFPDFDSNANLLSTYSERFDLRNVLSDRPRGSTFSYFGHVKDRLTMTEYPHYPALTEYLGLPPEGGSTHSGDVVIPASWETNNGSPHALPGTIVPFLELALGESDQSSKVSCNPAVFRKGDTHNTLLELNRPQGIRMIPVTEVDAGGHNAPISSQDKLIAKPISDEGAFRLQTSLNQNINLDSLVVNKQSDVLLVSFHGATNRETTHLPRFERLRTLIDYEVSSMFYSDATLQLNDSMQLAWFSGWEGEDLQWRIALEIVQVAAAIGASKIILSGSSGGGFAALQVSALIPQSVAVAFNAQTEISKYKADGTSSGVVRQYLSSVWPKISECLSPPHSVENESWSQHIDDRVSALRRYSVKRPNRVYIVQNMEEFHYEDHFLPFIETARVAGNDVIPSTNSEGPKHNPPHPETFNQVIREVLAKEQRSE